MNRLLLLVFLVGCALQVAADPFTKPAIGQQSHFFMENKGQVHSPDNRALPEILYQIGGNGVNVSLMRNAIHYTFYKIISGVPLKNDPRDPDTSSIDYETIGMDVTLVGANNTSKVTAEEPQEYYENYYTSLTRKQGGLSHVRSFAKIVYHDVYPFIDLVVYAPQAKATGVKYDFIVHPGGNPAAIQLKYSSTASLSLQENGSLLAANELGKLQEAAPYSYVRETGLEVASAYKLSGDVVSYIVARPTSGTLVIDPQVIWATYFGGAGRESTPSGANLDVSCFKGEAYICGQTYSVANIATFGSFKTHMSGGSDAYMARFTNAGFLIWATYYGGSGFEVPTAVVIDTTNSGSVYLCGFTSSPDSMFTIGSYQTTFAGMTDGFIAKFTLGGGLTRASYYGGIGSDAIMAAGCDPAGNLYVGGDTRSTAGIATMGTYTTAANSSDGNSFLAKFNAAGVRQWGTYYGGEGAESLYGIAVVGSGSVFVTGHTNSSTSIATIGSHQAVKGDSADFFLAKFSTAGTVLWATYYGGTGNEFYSKVACEGTKYVYLSGMTSSPDNMNTSGAHQPSNAGNTDAIIAKFNDSGVRLWGTYYGGNNRDVGHSICFAGNKLWITGGTYSSGTIATKGSYQDSLIGIKNAFILSMDTLGNRLWASYFGRGDDFGFAVAGDNTGNIFVHGVTNSDSLATNGAYQTINRGGGYDAFLLRIFDSVSILRLRNVHPYCVGDTFLLGHYVTGNGSFRSGNVFRVQLSNAAGSFTAPTVIGTLAASTGTNITCILPAGVTGTGYKLRTLSTKPVMISDTASIAISSTLPTPVITRNGGTLSTTSAFTSYQWYKNGVAIGGAISSSYTPILNGNYTVMVVAGNGCKGMSTVYNMTHVGVSTTHIGGDIKIYPNPTKDQLTIEGASPGTQVKITTLIGQQVAALIIKSREEVFPTKNLAAGVYILTFIDKDGRQSSVRIVKQ